jgi:type II secretory pathway component GspD/PulD (secretin)
MGNKYYKNTYHNILRLYCIPLLCLIFIIPGCKTISHDKKSSLEVIEQRLYKLNNLSCQQCQASLTKLKIDDFPQINDPNSIIVRSTSELLNKVNLVIELIDSGDKYAIENLGNASNVRNLPSNSQLSALIGNINIGTFSQPPQKGNKQRAIIDIFGDSVFAIIPAQYREQLLSLLSNPEKLKQVTETAAVFSQEKPVISEPEREIQNKEISIPSQNNSLSDTDAESISEKPESPKLPHANSTSVYAISDMGLEEEPKQQTQIQGSEKTSENNPDTDLPKTIKIVFKPANDIFQEPNDTIRSEVVEPENGNELLEMALPETLTLVQLLDLAGEHLDLDYVYNPTVIGNITVTLKLHGNLQGQMRVKDLYTLLETVLKFNNLAMIRRGNNLVAIVASDKVLEADPQFVGDDGEKLAVGDTVITRIFALKYVNASSVSKMLDNMKLGIAVTPMEDIQTLFVTCYAFRLSRIEQLVDMIDKPGRVRECRFRRIQYVTVKSLAEKIKTLAKELQGISITTSQPAQKPATAEPIKILTTTPATTGENVSVESRAKVPVFLDSDERTNRILMIGYEEELNLIEELINVLDIIPADQRVPETYTIKHLRASQALEKLRKMEVLKSSGSNENAGGASADSKDNILTEDPIVIILEATNQLLIKASQGQHVRIKEYLNYIDNVPEDSRSLEIYQIHYIAAGTVSKKLQELELISTGASAAALSPDSNSASITKPGTASSGEVPNFDIEKPDVVVNESSNELFIKANPEQHRRIASIIKRLDKKVAEEELSYKIYPLENSSPEHVASMLEKLIHEISANPDDKIEKPKNTSVRMSIVPDPNTFSLLIYTSEKNHKLVSDLIKSLDKRRPQVLIDVTLVEVTRNDTFEYDLNIVANANDGVINNIGITPLQTTTSGSLVEGGFNLLDKEGNPTGQTKAFYSDRNVQALLTAIRRKNYGRVLAQPKILVDDGQKGDISTIDQTTYLKDTIQVPNQGAPITTRSYEIIEAKLQLQIVPHISEGDLLRLDVHMSREDFGTRPSEGAPPDIKRNYRPCYSIQT